mmetsp:Transcript_13128/g.43059  ORF Transcript_13128/g.43059 Transcript_13128/m.43059 type:complete len:301 (+) Transcript_13128:307-1209(+)
MLWRPCKPSGAFGRAPGVPDASRILPQRLAGGFTVQEEQVQRRGVREAGPARRAASAARVRTGGCRRRAHARTDTLHIAPRPEARERALHRRRPVRTLRLWLRGRHRSPGQPISETGGGRGGEDLQVFDSSLPRAGDVRPVAPGGGWSQGRCLGPGLYPLLPSLWRPPLPGRLAASDTQCGLVFPGRLRPQPRVARAHPTDTGARPGQPAEHERGGAYGGRPEKGQGAPSHPPRRCGGVLDCHFRGGTFRGQLRRPSQIPSCAPNCCSTSGGWLWICRGGSWYLCRASRLDRARSRPACG